MSGSTGFLGKALMKGFLDKGWATKPINREHLSFSDADLAARISGSDVLINLAGAPVSKRWSPEWKNEIRKSRLDSTSKLISALSQTDPKPRLFISVSGTDIYKAGENHNEESRNYSDSFLGQVCLEWEAEASRAAVHCRVVIPRIGLVLGEDGGALKKMHSVFSLGLGAKIGNGEQLMPFIHIRDLVNSFIFLIENQDISGPVNVVSPYPVSNREFSETLGKVLQQPVFLSLPPSVLRLIYGEGAILLLEGRKVEPQKLTQAGFRYRYPTISNALVEIYG